MKKTFVVILIILLLGCSSQESLSRDDLCIQRTDDAKICYGMAREDVENVAGKAELIEFNMFAYEDDLRAIYRDNKLVWLVSKSKKYHHVSGIELGDLPSGLKNYYGFSSDNTVYFYDELNKKMVTELEAKQLYKESNYKPDSSVWLSSSVDKNGYIESIAFGDFGSRYGE